MFYRAEFYCEQIFHIVLLPISVNYGCVGCDLEPLFSRRIDLLSVPLLWIALNVGFSLNLVSLLMGALLLCCCCYHGCIQQVPRICGPPRHAAPSFFPPLLRIKEQIGLKSAIWYLWNTQKPNQNERFALAWESLLHLIAELNRPLSVKNIVCKPLSCTLSCQSCEFTVLLFCVCDQILCFYSYLIYVELGRRCCCTW